MTDLQPELNLTPEQQERADRFVQLLLATRIRMGGSRPASRRSLARQLEISATMVNRYETGTIDPAEIRFGVIAKLARVMGVSISAVAMYLLQGRTQSLRKQPGIRPVADLLEVPPRLGRRQVSS